MTYEIPLPLKQEHEALHEQLPILVGKFVRLRLGQATTARR